MLRALVVTGRQRIRRQKEAARLRRRSASLSCAECHREPMRRSVAQRTRMAADRGISSDNPEGHRISPAGRTAGRPTALGRVVSSARDTGKGRQYCTGKGRR